MKIAKVVFKEDSDGNSGYYMREHAWQVGDYFSGEFVRGLVDDIYFGDLDGVELLIDTGQDDKGRYVVALWIPLHAIQRIYYKG